MKFDVGQTLHGFVVEKKQRVEELDCTMYELTHAHSGARLVYLDRADDNKVFGIGFKTVPEDSTGVFHILEHCMLNGSEKFPLKEPFVNLLKNSMQTFLNAMTFPDKTVYPVASCNEKDFTNLMTVYLDAVFAPLLRTNENVFLQEGWHYELKDRDADPVYKGVVYNEMKGAMSSVFDVLDKCMTAALYPDTCYRFNSGGDPEHIPDLTYEQFLAAYRKHYHADNSVIFLYGTMDLPAKLALIDEEYLSRFSKSGSHIVIQEQAPVIDRNARGSYAIGPEDEEKDNAYCAIGWCIGGHEDKERAMAFDVLNGVLLSTNDSPLKKAIMEAGLGKDVKGDTQASLLQPAYILSLHKTNDGVAEQFEKVVRDTLSALVEHGLDREALEAAVNNYEFKLREMETGGFPKGVLLGLGVIGDAIYGGDPAASLRYEEAIRHMREGISEGYFEKLIETWLLGSKHYAIVTVTPSKTLAAEQEARAAEKLKAYKSGLSESETEELLALNERLAAFQSAIDTPEQLATLPSLTIDDLKEAPAPTPTEVLQGEGRTLLYHEVQTDGIAYLNLYYNLSEVPLERISALSAMASMLGALPTARHTAKELNTLVKLHLGDVRFSVGVYAKDTSSCMPVLTASCSVLEGKLDKAVDILREIMDETVFDEGEVAKLLEQDKAMTQMRIMQAGHMAALTMLGARLSAAGVCKEAASGVTYYRALQNTNASALIESIRGTEWKKSLTVSLTGSRAAKEECLALLGRLETSEGAMRTISPARRTGNPAVTIPAGISYVCKGASGFEGKYREGTLKVFEQILGLDYLWGEVRAKGGAYGVGVLTDRDSISFYSYRDPNVAGTLEAYDGAEEYLKNFSVSQEEMTGYVIGTIAGIERPRSPRLQGTAADSDYFNGKDGAYKAQVRREILATTQEDIRALASLIATVKEQNVASAVGNAEKISSCPTFDRTEAL